MAVIDVDSVAAENKAKLIDQALPCGFDAKDVEHFDIVVGDCLRCINLAQAHDLGQSRAICLDHPVVRQLNLAKFKTCYAQYGPQN